MASADPDATSSGPAARAQTLTRGFLFADLRGYTAFVESRGAVAGAELLYRYRALVREAVARHRGAEIKTEGDSFYVVFSSVSGAVACAIEIVRDAARANDQDATTPIQVGIGVHAGETVETPEGYVGSAVNLAARLCAAASAGEVLVSQTVRDLTANTSEVRFEAVGRRRLKGIAEPVAVHRAMAADAPRTRAPRSATPSRSLALSAIGAVVAVGITVALVASGALARIVGSTGTPSVGASASPGAPTPGPSITDIVIPAFVDGQPDPTPMPLAPGTYRLTAFRPSTTFAIGETGWRAIEDAPDTFELDRGDGGYVIGALIQVVNTTPCVDAPTRLLAAGPRAVIEWLQAAPYLETTDPLPVTAGGYAGLSVEISQAAPPTGCDVAAMPAGFAERDFLFRVGDHMFWIGPDEHVTVMSLDVGNQPVTFLVGARDQATYDGTVTAAQSIIDSVVVAR